MPALTERHCGPNAGPLLESLFAVCKGRAPGGSSRCKLGRLSGQDARWPQRLHQQRLQPVYGFGSARGAAAVDRNHTERAQRPAEYRNAEQRVLAQNTDFEPQRSLGGEAPNTVPVGRMRGDDEHHFGHIGQGAGHFPAAHAQRAARQPAQETVGLVCLRLV